MVENNFTVAPSGLIVPNEQKEKKHYLDDDPDFVPVDFTPEEIKKVNETVKKVQEKYVLRQNTAQTLRDYKDELIHEMYELGFEVTVQFHTTPEGNYYPLMEPKCRVDRNAQKVFLEEGSDLEKISWEARRNPRKDLEDRGIDVGMIG